MKFLFIFIIFVESYLTSFRMIIKKDIIRSVSSFMNLNEILVKNDYINSLRITKYNNNSICFNYNTYSYYNEYKYKNIYLIKNKNTYLTKYSFNIFNSEYNYLFYIQAIYKNPNRTIWNLIVKYNNLLVDNKELNDKLIKKYLSKCLNKNNEIIHPILYNYLK